MTETELNATVQQLFNDLVSKLEKKFATNKEWLTLKEGAAYAGVSYNTFTTYRLEGLKVCEINGVKRVSKTEIDNFLNGKSH